MKKLALVLAAVSVTASAATYYELAGKFSFPHQVVFMGYADKAACEGDKGTWEDDLGCIFDSEDTVEVSRDLTTVSIDTIHTNGHMCSVEAAVVAIEPDSIVAETPSDEWNEAKGDFETVTCRVTVKYSADNNTVDASTNGKCRSFCGANAIPEIEGAKRTGSF